MKFYVYLHRRVDTGAVFYVGKGKGRRAWNRCDRSAWWLRVVAKAGGFAVELITELLDEERAFQAERSAIACYRSTGELCNLTDGGEGLAGHVHSVETRERLRAAQLGRTHSVETRAKMSAAHAGRPRSPEHNAKLTAINIGRTCRPETREKIGAAQWGRTHSTETRAKMSAARLGKALSAEHRAKIGAAVSAAAKAKRQNRAESLRHSDTAA